jgi:branched-chain amino acid transport system substrate-binding protein
MACCMALALAGCGADKVEAAGTTGESGACVLTIGTLGPLSGPAADFGLSMKGTADLAAAEVNQQGGLRVGDRTLPRQGVALRHGLHERRRRERRG